MNNIEVPAKKPSLDVIYESTKYSLDNEWDLFKHYDTKASTLLAGATTILSVFIGIQTYIINLINRPESIESPTFYQYLLVIGIILFFSIVTARFLIGSIWSAITCLNQVEFRRVPNPVRLKQVFFNKTDLDTKVAILKEMIESWSKNHDIYNVKKAKSIVSSFSNLRLGIIFLITSITIDGILLSLYGIYTGGF